MPTIHPTAIVSTESRLADSVEIGPGCVISGAVTLGEGVRLVGNVYLQGPVTIGPGTIVYPFSTLGFPPQDYKFKLGDRTAGVVVGRDCIIREHVTIHAASNDHTPTRLGDRVFMMVSTHVGHDGNVGSGVIMVNNAGLAGHVTLGDGVTLSGLVGVHQHCRIGRLAFLSAGTGVSMDVPPFCVVPERNRLGGVNLVGLRRAGIPRDQITEIRRAYRDIFGPSIPRDEMIEILSERAKSCPPIAELLEFVKASKRGILPGPARPPRQFTAFERYRRRGKLVPDDDGDDEI